MKKIKKTIKYYRELLDLNQVELARKLKIPISTYNVYENGKRKVPLEVAKKISRILEVDLEDIFTPTNFIIYK